MRLAQKTAVTLAIIALLSTPATATWYAFGAFEPDTAYDDGSFMWGGPAPAGETRVYFNGLPMSPSATPSGKPGFNPNVGLLHTRIEPLAAERPGAMLGVWVDCNGDGYVGMAESAAREYSSALLLNPARCPPGTGPTSGWPAGAYNYNGWVTELIPIVNVATPFDSRTFRDSDAQVWVDVHRPDERPFQRTCRLTTFERGTLETVGGTLNFFDCYADLYGPWNDAMAAINDPLGLSFRDEDDGRSGALGRAWLGGPEGTDHAAVKTVDCEDAPIATVAGTKIRRPSPSLGPAATNPTQFTMTGQVNQTNEEWSDDCDASNDFGHDVYNLAEIDLNSVNPNNKSEPNWYLVPEIIPRGAPPFLVVGAGNAGMPQDGGSGFAGTRWVGETSWISKPGPRTARVDLENGGAEIAPAYWLSSYARVGSATVGRGQLLPGGDGVYGTVQCGGQFGPTPTPVIRNGWNCDPANWWRNPDGSFHRLKLLRPHVGWHYQLRDVDCYDGALGGTGLGVQPAYYGDSPCP